MDYFKIPYSVMEVNPLTKAEIKFSTDYRKVPIARIGDDVVKDSALIVDRLKGVVEDQRLCSPKELTTFFSDDAVRWAEWADKKLAVLLFPNITRNFSESFQAFKYVEVSICSR